jgi:hypothetical protein
MKTLKISSAPMVVVLSLTLLTLGCASCQYVQDQGVAPSTLNQDRIPIQVGSDLEVGINGVAGADTTVQVRSYGKGTVEIRGLGNCGYVSSAAINGFGFVTFNTATLPQEEFCLYNLQTDTTGFDAPAIGQLLVRRFLDPNVQPLSITANEAVRSGVNWVQVAGGSGISPLNTSTPDTGITEDRNISVNLGGHSGSLNITGCNGQTSTVLYTNAAAYNTTIDELFQGATPTSCVFTITANHTNAVAQSATLLVQVYQKFGSFLDAPIANGNCFSFTDQYAIGIGINGKWSWNSKGSVNGCGDSASSYQVEGVTSNQRIFFGISDGTSWSVMK